MIYPLVGLVLGLVIGAWRAKSRGGTRADMAQWAVAHGLGLAMVGLFLLVIVDRAFF